MTPKERLFALIDGKAPDRIPFAPAIYEHKAALIKKTPPEVCRDENLLYESVIAEYKTYEPDTLVVGIDIYNIEAEAIGSEINYETGTGVPTIKNRVLNESNLKELKIPDPAKDGRMPMIIKATERIQRELGHEVLVCAGVSGPFSLAASLMGDENLLIASIEDPDYVQEVLKFTTETAKVYTSALLKTGADVMIFDSAAAPPLVSPNQYTENIFPHVKELLTHTRANGSRFRSYIVGGNTIDSVEYFVEAGARNVICDFNADLKAFIEKLKDRNVIIRKNFNPALLTTGKAKEIDRAVEEIMELNAGCNGLIFGTGILPYDIQSLQVLFLKKKVSTYKL